MTSPSDWADLVTEPSGQYLCRAARVSPSVLEKDAGITGKCLFISTWSVVTGGLYYLEDPVLLLV